MQIIRSSTSFAISNVLCHDACKSRAIKKPGSRDRCYDVDTFGVAGEAVQIAEEQVPEPALESDPMFDAPQLLSSGTGAKVLFTTADIDDNLHETKQRAAALHFWDWNRNGEEPGAANDDT